MRNKLLITTALVAVSFATNVYAEALPTDATNLTTGKYVVEDTGVRVIHAGDVKVSEDATLKVETYTFENAFQINGDLEIGDEENGGGALELSRNDNKKVVMSVDGDMTVYDGATVNLKNEVETFATITNTGNVDVKGGTVNLDGGEIFSEGNLNVSGGVININQGGIEIGEDINITGGEVNVAGDGMWAGGLMTIGKGAMLNITSDELPEYGPSDETAGGEDLISGTNVAADKGIAVYGTLNMTNSVLEAGNDMDELPNNSSILLDGASVTMVNSDLEANGNITIKNSKLDVKSDTAEFGIWADKDITIEGSEITLNNAYMAAEVINLINGGKINLDGTLKANIDGDDRGEIVFGNANAVVQGDVDTPSLTFMSDHSMSKAITGTLGSVDKLTVAKGTLNFDKEMKDHTITTVEVASGATLDIGMNTLHSTGDKVDGEGVLFKDNSTLKFTATGADEHGKILANYVNISENGTTLDMTLNGAVLAEGETIDIQLFDQSEDEEGVEIEGKFANLTSNVRYAFADKGNGVYTVTGVRSAADVVAEAGGNANNVSTAEAWDSIDTSKVSNSIVRAIVQKLAELSNRVNDALQKAYVDALTAIAPDVAPAVQQTSTETANQVFGAVGTRLSGGSVASSSQGMSSGDNPFERVAVWVQGLFNKSKLDDTSKAKGFDSDTYGTAFGIEKMLDSHRKVGVGYAYSKTDIDGFMRDTDVKTHTAILYGEYKPSNWYVNGIATYGWSDYEESKNVAGIGVKADYDVEMFGLQAMTGYDMNFNGAQLTPEAGLRYVHISQDGYKDSADQKVSGNDSDILTGVIGAKVSKNFELSNGMMLKPEVKVAATYDLLNDKVNSVVTLANGSAYSVSGKSLNRFGMEFGAGVSAEVDDNIELSLGYEGKFRENYQDHTGLINAKYKF